MSTAVHDLTVTDYPTADLAYYKDNPREGDVVAIAESLAKVGQYKPIVVNRGTLTGRPNEVLAGNHTLKAAATLSWATVKAVTVDVDDEQAVRIVLADNKTADLGGYDNDILSSLLVDLPDLEGTGYTPADLDELLDVSRDYADALDGNTNDPFDAPAGEPNTASPATPDAPNTETVKRNAGVLAARFGVPPFTVIDTRNGDWKKRGEAWKSLGLKSEVGREGALLYKDYTQQYSNWMDVQTKARLADPDISRADIETVYAAELQPFTDGSGTSVFDPALCEILVSWFSPAGGTVLDPWAGGSVRGVVAAALGRDYTGIDLRAEQVEANEQQWRDIGPALTDTGTPSWLTGDSRKVLDTLPAESFDMAIGCPPYYDLEAYSDNPDDLSTLSTADFDAAMAQTMISLARCLRPNSFAAFVVGGVRDKRGDLRDMKRCMINAADAAGMKLANDAVLVNSVGTVAITAGRQFSAGRSLGRVHQEIVVFVKGDRKTAAKRCGEVTLADLPEADFEGGDE